MRTRIFQIIVALTMLGLLQGAPALAQMSSSLKAHDSLEPPVVTGISTASFDCRRKSLVSNHVWFERKRVKGGRWKRFEPSSVTYRTAISSRGLSKKVVTASFDDFKQRSPVYFFRLRSHVVIRCGAEVTHNRYRTYRLDEFDRLNFDKGETTTTVIVPANN